jgi:cytochrome c oxidase subunit III
MSTVTMVKQREKMHPHKLALLLGLGSVVMMFAGLTSAYIVKRNQPNWSGFELPQLFWYSTLFILISSVTVHMAKNAFNERLMSKYRTLISVTMILGVLFLVMQCIGFYQFWQRGLVLNKSVAYSFLYVIVGLHGLHVIGGVFALIKMFVTAFSGRTKNYNPVAVDMMATYWHFVDGLWIYLLVFLIWIK